MVQAILSLSERDPTFNATEEMRKWIKAQGGNEFGPPEQLGGATVQRNLKTGEIKSVVPRPPVTTIQAGPQETGLDSNTIEMLAQQYIQSNTIPSLGYGKAGALNREAVLKRAAELKTGGGAVTPEEAAAQIISSGQDVKATNRAVAAFSSGPLAARVTANNTALNHLETMSKLANDLNNSDPRIFNMAANAFKKQAGSSSAPTNFDAAKQIVASEVIKAVVNNGGGVTERLEAAESFNKASSPAQLKGVIDTYKELLGGQLDSLEQQYTATTNRPASKFRERLSPATQQVLEKAKTPVAGGKMTPEAFNAKWSTLKSGESLQGPDGKTYTKR